MYLLQTLKLNVENFTFLLLSLFFFSNYYVLLLFSYEFKRKEKNDVKTVFAHILVQQKPLNVITFGETKNDNIKRKITKTDDINL